MYKVYLEAEITVEGESIGDAEQQVEDLLGASPYSFRVRALYAIEGE